MNSIVTTIIIDMYGVILKERTGNFGTYTYEHFPQSEHERLDKIFNEERLFTKAGYGEITSHDFLTRLGFTDPEYHMRDYIENYLTLDKRFISFAEKYYEQYEFVLLSTDVSEWSRYITKYYELDKYFKYKIVSGDVHCRKPDRKIYEIALARADKTAEECIFIDDSIANINAAKDMGIHTVLFNRFGEDYSGDQVKTFEELDKLFNNL